MIYKAQYLRDKVILSFLADTRCRVSELLKVKVGHIDLENRTVLISHLKYGRKRCPDCGKSAWRNQRFCSYCGCDLVNALSEGTEQRKRLIKIKPATAAILREYIPGMRLSESLINITRQQVYVVVRELARAIGLRGRVLNPKTGKYHFVNPSTFRHCRVSGKPLGNVTVTRKGKIHRLSDRAKEEMIAMKRRLFIISHVGISQNEEEKEPIRSSIPNGCVPLRGGKYDIPVAELGLSVRTMNCLRRGGISTVGEVIIKSEQELFSLRNWGQKSKQELNECLNALALDGDTID